MPLPSGKWLFTFTGALLAAVLTLVWLMPEQGLFGQNEEILQEDTVQASPQSPALFGLPIEDYEVEEAKIQRNEHLSAILSRYNVSSRKIDSLARLARPVFDPRKLVTGKPYHIFCSPDSNKQLCYLVYRPNAVEYVVFQLRDSLHVYRGEKKVDTVRREVAGIITQSLYETIQEQELPILLVNKLSDIFAWQVDFFRIDKGDRFKVLYEELQVDSQFYGIGRIRGAYFEHRDDTFYAVRFVQDNRPDYFDMHNNSLRKALLKAPLQYSRISSRFSYRRYHPVHKRYKPHYGTDYAAPRGTPVRAVGDGTVIEAGYKRYNGNYVKIRHNSVYTTGYLHLSGIAGGITKGATVRQGQTIGYVGSTGLATGPHLCYRMSQNGRPVDHRQIELPPSEPIQAPYRETYDSVKAVVTRQLDRISYSEPEA